MKLVGNSPYSNLKDITFPFGSQIYSILKHRNQKLSRISPGSISLIPGVYSTLLKYFRNIVLVTNSTQDYANSVIQHLIKID